MAEFMEALNSRLNAVTGVTNLVSTRIYPVRLPQDVTYPAVRVITVDAQRESALDTDMGLVHTRIQVDAYATTYAGSQTLAAALRAALKRASWTQDAVEVCDALLDNVQDDYEDEAKAYRVRQDFVFMYRE